MAEIINLIFYLMRVKKKKEKEKKGKGARTKYVRACTYTDTRMGLINMMRLSKHKLNLFGIF